MQSSYSEDRGKERRAKPARAHAQMSQCPLTKFFSFSFKFWTKLISPASRSTALGPEVSPQVMFLANNYSQVPQIFRSKESPETMK